MGQYEDFPLVVMHACVYSMKFVNFLKGSNFQEKLKIYITSWKSLQRGSGVCLHVVYVYVLICMQRKVKIPSLNREAAQTEGLRFGF